MDLEKCTWQWHHLNYSAGLAECCVKTLCVFKTICLRNVRCGLFNSVKLVYCDMKLVEYSKDIMGQDVLIQTLLWCVWCWNVHALIWYGLVKAIIISPFHLLSPLQQTVLTPLYVIAIFEFLDETSCELAWILHNLQMEVDIQLTHFLSNFSSVEHCFLCCLIGPCSTFYW